jgi:hypothetical protein
LLVQADSLHFLSVWIIPKQCKHDPTVLAVIFS